MSITAIKFYFQKLISCLLQLLDRVNNFKQIPSRDDWFPVVLKYLIMQLILNYFHLTSNSYSNNFTKISKKVHFLSKIFAAGAFKSVLPTFFSIVVFLFLAKKFSRDTIFPFYWKLALKRSRVLIKIKFAVIGALCFQVIKEIWFHSSSSIISSQIFVSLEPDFSPDKQKMVKSICSFLKKSNPFFRTQGRKARL